MIIRPSKKGLFIQSEEKTTVPPIEEWDALFKKAIAAGQAPEDDTFDGLENLTDESEWTCHTIVEAYKWE